jgi:hypothetical protein
MLDLALSSHRSGETLVPLHPTDWAIPDLWTHSVDLLSVFANSKGIQQESDNKYIGMQKITTRK